MVGEGKGGFISPKFHPALDAQSTVVKTLELLARAGEPLSRVRVPLLASCMVREHVSCQPEMKGAIMRDLIEATKEERGELMDGIRIFHDDAWVSIIPDEDRPFFHGNAEAPEESTARKLTQPYTELVRSWQD